MPSVRSGRLVSSSGKEYFRTLDFAEAIREEYRMRIIRYLGVLFFAVACVCIFTSAQPASADSPHAAPVNSSATPEARALLKQIDQISGRFTLTGQHNFPNHVSRWSDRIYDLTGKFPAIFGQDFGFSGGEDKDSVEGRPSMIEEAKRQYRNGAVIALTWHAVRPTDDEPVTFRDSVQGHLTDFEWNELLTPGTDLNNRWVEQVDVIAGYLRQLQDAGVPVLFRPYHEMNGNWFWWGARPGEHGSAALYRQLYDRFVNLHHLNNLVWVWNVNSPSENAGSIAEYFPGLEFADVVTMDIYGEFKRSYYDDMVALAGDKPIALAEVGAMPTPDALANQPRWAYFMMWSGLAESSNSPEQLQTMFHSPNLLNRGDPPFIAPAAPGTSNIEPVTPKAISQVKSLIDRFYRTRGTQVLSGQINAANSLTAATQQVFQATTQYPAIFALDVDTTGEADSTKQLIDDVIQQNGVGSIVRLRWLAPNPADVNQTGSAGNSHASRPTALTDFEWNELTMPGTNLYQNWCTQVDAVATALKKLQDKNIAVLWTPYPQLNGKQYWWAGRAGIHGSAALYRMLFDRLVNHDEVHNLVWVWQAAPGGFGSGAIGPYGEFFPGFLYVDALELSVNRTQSRFRSDTFLQDFAVDKVIGIEINGPAPAPAFFSRETNWAWFLLAPQPSGTANDAATTQALRTLYGDPRVMTR
jgi:mannan endo-1,4-beta-mannosidase